MAGRLFPAIATPLPIERRQTVTTVAPAYPKAPLWDFLAGDVVRDGNGHVVMADGYTAWKQCVQAVVLVQKNAYRVYPRRFGPDLERATHSAKRAIVQAEIARTIKQALKSDPRTKDVGHFTFTWSSDTVQIGFTVTPVVGPPSPIAASLGL